MKRVFDDSFKRMAVELSYRKGAVLEAAKELVIDASRLSKWRMDPRYNGGTVLKKKLNLSSKIRRKYKVPPIPAISTGWLKIYSVEIFQRVRYPKNGLVILPI